MYSNSAYLPNIPYYEFDIKTVDFRSTDNRLLFVGNMSYGPNLHGVETFVRDILPFVRQEVPDAEIHLVGGCNEKAFIERISAIQGVKYMGFVDNLQKEYEEARVVVAPVFWGAGTNIKVLEAMRMKRPCVTTSYGMRGFVEFFSNNKVVAIANTSQEFAAAVVMLLRDENANHAIANQAFKVVEQNFTREAFNTIVYNTLSSIV